MTYSNNVSKANNEPCTYKYMTDMEYTNIF